MQTRHARLSKNLFLLLLVLLCVSACSEVWAQSIAQQVASDMAKISSYQGVTLETGIAEEPVRRKVEYQEPGRFRVETLSPASHAGELVLYDGDRVVYWWPSIGFGMELLGASLPTAKETRAHLERLTSASLDAYAFSLRSEYRKIAEERAKEWRVIPTRKQPYRMKHKVWTHFKYSLPLKMVFEESAKSEWYSMAFESIAFNKGLADGAFDFQFPKNAIVFRWDLRAEGISIETAKEQMNFAVKQVSKLPKGHTLQKILKLDNALPMLSMIMDKGASKLSLTQNRFLGTAIAPLGKHIKIRGQDAILSFLGPFSSISWVADGTQLTLTGNLGYVELIAIAESVE